MFCRINAKITDKNSFITDRLKSEGKKLLDEKKDSYFRGLDECFLRDYTINADEIAQRMFPIVEADIFLSHSHKDKGFVEAFAAWLYVEFEIKCFVDSVFWESSEELIKNIVKRYCEENGKKRCSPKQINQVRTHVNLILNGALMKMIDETECFMFINTPNALQTRDFLFQESITTSPWIYSELLISKLIRVRQLDKHTTRKKESGQKEKNESIGLVFNHNASINHLVNVDYSEWELWEKECKGKKSTEALDALYRVKGILVR